MSKITAKQVYITPLPNKEMAVTFVATDRYAANLFVQELQHLDLIDITAKAHKESRSLQQNKMMWSLITMISEHLYHDKSEEVQMKVYGEMLVRANVKRDLIAVIPDAVETLKLSFRAVIPTNQTITSTNEKTGKKAQLQTYWVYHGSSKYNTKEMSELIEVILNYCGEIGLEDSEIASIRSEYGI